MNILGISGSLRAKSHNTALLARIGKIFSSANTFQLLGDVHEIPVFSEDVERSVPPSVVKLWKKVRAADLIVFATPEYNQSLPGGLKNLIDWTTRDPCGSPLQGKSCAVTGATVGGWGTRLAQQQLRTVLMACGAFVLPAHLYVANAKEGHFGDENLDSFVEAVLRADQILK